MKKFKDLIEADAKDYKKEKDSKDEVKDIEPRSDGEKKFRDFHKTDRKKHPTAGDEVFDGNRKGGKVGKSGQDKTGYDEPGEPILKTYAQFAKMGGHGGDSYKGVGKSAGEKAAVMQGSSKIKEAVELDEDDVEEVELNEKMEITGYHFLHGLKNQNMKMYNGYKTKKDAEVAAKKIISKKGGTAEIYANMFDPNGRRGHQDYPKLLKSIKEEVELDEGSRTFGSASKKAEVSRQRAIEKAKRWMKSTGKSAEDAVKEFDLFSSDIRKLKEEVELDEGFINIGGAKVKDDEKSILQHIKKTFPNVKKIRKDPQHGWIPVFEEVELVDEAFKAGKIQFKDGKYKVIDEKTASILNNAMKELNTTNRKRMETEAKKDTQSFEAMLKFAKAAA